MNNSKKRSNPIIRLLGDNKYQFITIPVLAVLCSLLLSALIILVLGQNPILAFKGLLQGAGVIAKEKYAAFQGQIPDFMETLDRMTPMLFAALSVAIAMKAGLFNIGVSGQMMISAFIATVTVGYAKEMNPIIAKPLVVLIGVLVGAFAGGLIGILKVKFNINEVVSSIMLNYIFQYIVSFFINTKYVDPVSRQSRVIGENARLTLMNVEVGAYKLRIPLFFIIAIITAIVLNFIINRTKHGFEINAVGFNKSASKYAGIHVNRKLFSVMVMSGAFAGLAGITFYLGYRAFISPGILPSTGFDAIAVSLLGNNHPIGIIFSSLLITIIDRGGTYMRTTSGVEQEIAALISGLILLFSAMGDYFKQIFSQKLNRKAGK